METRCRPSSAGGIDGLSLQGFLQDSGYRQVGGTLLKLVRSVNWFFTEPHGRRLFCGVYRGFISQLLHHTLRFRSLDERKKILTEFPVWAVPLHRHRVHDGRVAPIS